MALNGDGGSANGRKWGNFVGFFKIMAIFVSPNPVPWMSGLVSGLQNRLRFELPGTSTEIDKATIRSLCPLWKCQSLHFVSLLIYPSFNGSLGTKAAQKRCVVASLRIIVLIGSQFRVACCEFRGTGCLTRHSISHIENTSQPVPRTPHHSL